MKAADIFEKLSGNVYPGRGIIIGESEDGKKAVTAYFIMGRSVNSRNRVFETVEDGLRTKAYDPEKLVDPSLVIYFPVRVIGSTTIVTNGDQTDTIYDFLRDGKTFEDALRTRTFEPDPPIFTPRISGLLTVEDGKFSYKLSILKSVSGDGDGAARQFFDYDSKAGLGHFIHTYMGDGDPVPSFEGEPEPVVISGDIDSFTNIVWNGLNNDNKVSLFVRYIDLTTGETETRVVNKNV